MFSRLSVQIAAAGSSMILLITTGTIVFRFLEDWTFIKSFYFSVVILSTVGFGDLHPTSDVSRLFTAFYILVGVPLALASLAVIGTTYLKSREDSITRKRGKSGKGNLS